MRGVSLDHIQRLVDGAADDGVEELERILATEEVEPNEGGGGRAKLTCCQVGERRRDAARSRRPGPRPRGAGPAPPAAAERGEPDDPRNALRADFQQTRRALGGRAGSLPGNRVEHRADEEWVATGRRLEGGAEGLVRLQAVQLAREHRDRATPKRLGANRGDLRVGDQLGDKDGIVALALGGRVPATTRSAALPPAFASGTAATAGGSVRPLQIIDGEQRRPLQGHVGREPVEAVDDREGPSAAASREPAGCEAPNSDAMSAAGPESSSTRRSGETTASSGSNSCRTIP